MCRMYTIRWRSQLIIDNLDFMQIKKASIRRLFLVLGESGLHFLKSFYGSTF